MFTQREFELLTKGLDAFLAKAGQEALIGMMFGAMLARSKEEAERNAQDETRKLEAQKASQEVLQEEIILLKAKLIQWRRQSDAALDGELIRILGE